MTGIIKANGLTLSYGRTAALRGVSLAIGDGEIVAITGPSGSGKSSLLHCLAGVLRPDAGEVHYAGKRIDDWPEARRSRLRRTEFGLLFQFGQLVAELSAVENVALPLLLAGTGRREAEKAAGDWLTRVGVADAASKRPGELSGGEQQRVALARALVTRPKVLFADEPTGALDSLAGERVLDLIVEAARERAMTVVLVTHDARIAGYADHEICLRDGQIDRSGLGLDARPVAASVGGDR